MKMEPMKIERILEGVTLSNGSTIKSHPLPKLEGNKIILPKGSKVEVNLVGGGTDIVEVHEDWVGTFMTDEDTE